MTTEPAIGKFDAISTRFNNLALLNKAASDALRLEVLRVLHNNAYGVLELCHILDVKQSALSHHLKILAQAELVSTRREGNSIFYRRQSLGSDNLLQPLQQALFNSIDAQPLSMETTTRIQQIQQDRAASSANFFRQQAEGFEQQQERIATYSLYGKGVMDLLHKSSLKNFDCALEVGSGNGEFLAELSPLFKRVLALDNSREMLTRAQKNMTALKLANIEFLHSDTRHAAEQVNKKKLQADCVVLNMVLHHTPAPADIFNDIFPMMNNDGILLITELCRHHQDWAKDACGDLWLGFEPDELLTWADSAGFVQQHSVYHALRNGFQIQMHSFVKKVLLTALPINTNSSINLSINQHSRYHNHV
jgi:DNA-binding transcriptional ArsR family regulator/ubiquinone/menaquinone biosynthesis C-methylase UbiE